MLKLGLTLLDIAPFKPNRNPPMTHFQTHCKRLFVILGLMASTASMAQICTRDYVPVCGQVTGESGPRNFPNRCELDGAKATFLKAGQCTPIPAPRPGSDADSHGCKASAGFQWDEELVRCVRPGISSAVTLQVASKRRHCSGAIDTECLQVRELVPGNPPQKWTPFIGEITGFKHVPGKRYTLRVRKDKLGNATGNAPNIRYTLLKLLP